MWRGESLLVKARCASWGVAARVLQLCFLKACNFHQVVLQPGLQWPIGMDRYGNTGVAPGLGVDVVTSVDPLQFPAFLFQKVTNLWPLTVFKPQSP